MTELVRIAHNAVTAKLVAPSREVLLIVQALLSYAVEGAEHSEAFQKRSWDGRSTFLDFSAGSFPAGFVSIVQKRLQARGYQVALIRKPLPEPLGPEEPVVDTYGYDPRYDYQPETVRRLERHGQIIAQIATGGGKSRTANLAVARIKRKTLFLTTRGVLMYQMRDAFLEGLKARRDAGEVVSCSQVGVLGDGEWKPSDYINVGMVQTLMARLETTSPNEEFKKLMDARVRQERKMLTAAHNGYRKAGLPKAEIERRIRSHAEDLKAKRLPRAELEAQARKIADKHNAEREKTVELLASFEFAILEEAHEAGGNGYFEIMRHCRSAHYRLALTATPFMRDDEEANMRLMACSGPIAIKVSEKMLIELGILARPYFKTIPTQYLPDKSALIAAGDKASTTLGRTSPWQRAYRLGVVYNQWRNARIVDECLRAARLKLPVMILVAHKAHGELLKTMLRDRGLAVDFIFGEHEQVERKAALGRLKSLRLQVLIGSTILDVGVDVPAVGLVILAAGGKAEVQLRQRIGRGLRAKKLGPNVALIIDFMDEINFHLKSHSVQRRNIIESTPGFVEGLLPIGTDFDLTALGLAA